MRREWRLLAIASIALAVGVLGAEPYARLASPVYAAAARIIALGHPWQIISIGLGPGGSGPGSVLRLTGAVRARSDDPTPAAVLVGKLQADAVVESPVIFWAILLAWPATSVRQRFAYVALGIPLFVCLEIATTVCELVNPLAYASAVLAGNPDPLTGWERWTRFLEAGGRVALALIAALLAISLARTVKRAA